MTAYRYVRTGRRTDSWPTRTLVHPTRPHAAASCSEHRPATDTASRPHSSPTPYEAAGGIAVSVNVGDEIVAGTIDEIRTAGAVRVLSGGRAIADAVYARRLGADAYSDINALAWFDAMNTTP